MSVNRLLSEGLLLAVVVAAVTVLPLALLLPVFEAMAVGSLGLFATVVVVGLLAVTLSWLGIKLAFWLAIRRLPKYEVPATRSRTPRAGSTDMYVAMFSDTNTGGYDEEDTDAW